MKNKFRERGTGENFSLADMLYIQNLMDSNRSAAWLRIAEWYR